MARDKTSACTAPCPCPSHSGDRYLSLPGQFCVILYVIGSTPRLFQASHLGRTASIARCPSSSSVSRNYHQFHNSAPASHRTFRTACSVAFPPGSRALRRLYLHLCNNAWNSKGGESGRTVADALDTVWYPITILMAVVLCNLLNRGMLRRFATRSSAHTGAPDKTRDLTTPSYSHTAPPAPSMFGRRPIGCR